LIALLECLVATSPKRAFKSPPALAQLTTWFSKTGAVSNAEYLNSDVRAFNTAMVRAYACMQRAQTCVEVVLPRHYFGRIEILRHTVWCCRVSDNTAPRIACEDRELTLRIVRPYLMGVDASKHGGPWLSRALIYSFLAGLSDYQASDDNFVCRCALGLLCPGKKANEAHQLQRDLKLADGKEKKKYVMYEPTDMEYAND
jgi:hypothetical protein